LLVAFVALTVGTVEMFFMIDAQSRSASDTLRPLLLTMVPVWAVVIWAARVVLRSSSR
jgi:hypothetical protein